MLDEIPISTIEPPYGWFQTFPDISMPEKLTWKSHRSQNKTFIRGVSPGVPYSLWNKQTIDWQRWNIATQERKVCNMEIEIVAFFIKGSAQLTVPPDRQVLLSIVSLSQAQQDTSDRDNYQNMDYWLTIRHRCIDMWSWTEMLTVSFQPRAKTVWIPLRMSTETCRPGDEHNWCPLECRLSVWKPFLK